MKTTNPKITPIVFIILLIMVAVCLPTATWADSQISTDKDIYQVGETIRVNFYNAPGLEQDWICVVPAGSPDNEAGNYKYMPPGVVQGVLTFDCSSPGKYEVRAYYNYRRYGYMVSARHGFSVAGDPTKPVMERKIDLNNPLEANLPPGKGLVYIFRESSWLSQGVEVQIEANGKVITTMPDSSYFASTSPAGEVLFSAGGYFEQNSRGITTQALRPARPAEKTIIVKPGYVYYLNLTVKVMNFFFLDHVPHEEGAKSINSNNLTLLK